MEFERKTDTVALKKRMIDCGLERISDLERASGVNRNTIGGVLRGEIQPSADVMYKLAKALSIEPSEAGTIFLGMTYAARKS